MARTLALRWHRARLNRIRKDRPAVGRFTDEQLDPRLLLNRACRADIRALVAAGYTRLEISALMGYDRRDMVDQIMRGIGAGCVLPAALPMLALSAAALAVGGGHVARLACGLGYLPAPSSGEVQGDGDVTAESLLLAEAHGGTLVTSRTGDTAAMRRHADNIIRAAHSIKADADAIDARAMVADESTL